MREQLPPSRLVALPSEVQNFIGRTVVEGEEVVDEDGIGDAHADATAEEEGVADLEVRHTNSLRALLRSLAQKRLTFCYFPTGNGRPRNGNGWIYTHWPCCEDLALQKLLKAKSMPGRRARWPGRRWRKLGCLKRPRGNPPKF